MRVSVVIPTYNSGPLVVEALESVLAQTRPVDEILVVDDGSTDDTAERLARFGSSVRVIYKENGGVATARNRGAAEATGALIAFLDADDVWHPRKMELQLPILETRSDLGMLGTGLYDWPVSPHPVFTDSAANELVNVPFRDLVVRNRFATSTVVIRSEVLRSVGEFDTNQFGTEDHDLWLRIAQQVAVANLRCALAGYRATTPGSLSKNAVRMEAGMRIILQKLEDAGVFQGKPFFRRKAWARFRSSCGLLYRDAGFQGAAARQFALSLLGWPFGSLSDPGSGGVLRFAMLAMTVRNILTGRGSSSRPNSSAP